MPNGAGSRPKKGQEDGTNSPNTIDRALYGYPVPIMKRVRRHIAGRTLAQYEPSMSQDGIFWVGNEDVAIQPGCAGVYQRQTGAHLAKPTLIEAIISRYQCAVSQTNPVTFHRPTRPYT